jgi:hypothetical protein
MISNGCFAFYFGGLYSVGWSVPRKDCPDRNLDTLHFSKKTAMALAARFFWPGNMD